MTCLDYSDSAIYLTITNDNLTPLLGSNRYNNVVVSVTTRCNLRCIYCGVSQPSYHGEDPRPVTLGGIAQGMKRAQMATVKFNGHGETTLINGWQHPCRELIDAGFSVGITSNFAKEFSKEEIVVLAQTN